MKKTLIWLFLALPVLTFAQPGTTFKLCDYAQRPLHLNKSDLKAAMEKRNGTGIEAWSDHDKVVHSTKLNPFIEAVHLSYASHRPLTLSPDMIWLVIAQGFAQHVDKNSEELRSYFVDFDGKKVLKVRRDEFTKGSPNNDWPGVFPEFTRQIGEYTGKKLLNTTLLNFSTTGVAEKAAFEVTLMDAMSSYFIYAVYSDCGITEITLEGTPEDWKLLLKKAKELRQYKLDWWIDELVPVLEEFVKASEGKVTHHFWNQFYKSYVPGSGSTTISGWITKLYPYIVVNEKVVKNSNFNDHLTTENFTSGMSKADFYWIYFGTPYQMEFLAGFAGVEVNEETGGLRPVIGWGIRDTGKTGIKAEESKYSEDILTPPK